MPEAQTQLRLYEMLNAHRVWLGKVDMGGWRSQIHLHFSDEDQDETETTLCGINMTLNAGGWWSDIYWDEQPLVQQISCKRCLKSIEKRYRL